MDNLEIPSTIPDNLLILPSESYTMSIDGIYVIGKRRNYSTTLVENINTSIYLLRYTSFYLESNYITIYSNDVITIINNNEIIPNGYNENNYSYLKVFYVLKNENVSLDILGRNADIENNITGIVGQYTTIQNNGIAEYQSGSDIKTTITFTPPKNVNPLYEYRIGFGKTNALGIYHSGYKQARFTIVNNPQSDALNNDYIQDLPIENIQFPNNTGFLKITNGILSYDATGGGGSSSSEQVDLSPYALISSLNNYTLQTTFNTLETTIISDYALKTTLNDYLLTTDILENSKIKTEIMPPYLSSFNDITGSLSQYITDTFSFLQYGDLQAGNNISFTSASGGGITINAVNTDTDTTYTGGTGITITGTTINCDVINTDTTYTGGTGITITGTTINCDVINTDTTYTAGSGININNTEISIDPSFSSGSGSEYTQKPTILGTFSLEENLNNVSGGVRDIHYFDERIFITDDDGYHSIIELALKYVSGSYVEQTFDLYVGEVMTVSFLLVDTNYYNFIQNIDLQVGTYQIVLKTSSVELWYNGNMINYSSITIPSEGFINDIDPHNINYIQGTVKCIIRYKKLYKTPQIYYNDVPFITDIYQGLVSNNMLGLWASRLYLGGPTDIGQFIQTKSVEGGTGYEWSKFLNYENLTTPPTNGYLKYDGTNWIIDADGGSSTIAPYIPVNKPSNTLSYRRAYTEEQPLIYETAEYIVFDEEVEFNNAVRLERVNETIWFNLSIYNSTDKTFENRKDQADIFLCNDINHLVFDRHVLSGNLETYGTLFRINYQYKLHILNSSIKSYVDFECPKIIFGDGSFIDSANNLGGGGDVSYPLSGDGIFSTGQEYKSTDGINRLKFLDNSATYIQANNVIGNRILGIDKLSINQNDIMAHVNLSLGTGTYITFADGTTLSTKPSNNYNDLDNLPTLYDGNLILPNNQWINSADGYNRFNFSTASSSYIRAPNLNNAKLYLQIGVSTKITVNGSDYVYIPATGYSGSLSYARPYWGFGSTSINTSTYNFPTSLKTSQAIQAGSYFITSSDQRIKRDIKDLDDKECLNKVLALKPKKYKYKDTIVRGDREAYGFIAQEVEQIIPDLVKTTSDSIPNLYFEVKHEDSIITIPDDKNYIGVVGVRLTINDYYGDGNEVEIIEYINDKQFKIDKPIATEECFLIGEFVKDFKKLNKDGFHALSISSIQELYKMIIEQKEEIRMLKQHLNLV